MRCGSCNELFDGNATLVDAVALKEAAVPWADALPAAIDAMAPASSHELDFDTSHDPFGILPGQPEPSPGPEAASRQAAPAAEPPLLQEPQAEVLPPAAAPFDTPEPGPGAADVEQIVALPVPEDGNFLPVKRSRPEPAAVVVPVVAPVPEPEFVTQGRRRQSSGKKVRILMAGASLLLLLALLGQGLSVLRNPLAAHMPSLKPALLALCASLGCRVEMPAQIDYVTIDQGELQTLSENTFSYATVLHNQGSTLQAWPDIELILNDGSDRPVLRRVFTPSEFLGPPSLPEQGLAAHSEQAVKLYFELAGVKASGYHIAVFYP